MTKKMTIEDFKEAFLKVKNMGFVPMVRGGSPGN